MYYVLTKQVLPPCPAGPDGGLVEQLQRAAIIIAVVALVAVGGTTLVTLLLGGTS
jgi:hypothetical protein